MGRILTTLSLLMSLQVSGKQNFGPCWVVFQLVEKASRKFTVKAQNHFNQLGERLGVGEGKRVYRDPETLEVTKTVEFILDNKILRYGDEYSFATSKLRVESFFHSGNRLYEQVIYRQDPESKAFRIDGIVKKIAPKTLSYQNFFYPTEGNKAFVELRARVFAEEVPVHLDYVQNEFPSESWNVVAELSGTYRQDSNGFLVANGPFSYSRYEELDSAIQSALMARFNIEVPMFEFIAVSGQRFGNEKVSKWVYVKEHDKEDLFTPGPYRAAIKTTEKNNPPGEPNTLKTEKVPRKYLMQNGTTEKEYYFPSLESKVLLSDAYPGHEKLFSYLGTFSEEGGRLSPLFDGLDQAGKALFGLSRGKEERIERPYIKIVSKHENGAIRKAELLEEGEELSGKSKTSIFFDPYMKVAEVLISSEVQNEYYLNLSFTPFFDDKFKGILNKKGPDGGNLHRSIWGKKPKP